MHPPSRALFRAVGYDHPRKFRFWIWGKARGVTAIRRKMMRLAECAALRDRIVRPLLPRSTFQAVCSPHILKTYAFLAEMLWNLSILFPGCSCASISAGAR